jgi:transposase
MLRARGFPGSVVQLRRYVATVRPVARAEAYLRLRTLPGEQGQVDWGHFGKLAVGRALRPLSCFVLVLGWSRGMYARFFLDQTLDSFVRGHVLAFEALGGVPRVLLYDNLKTAVLERHGEHIASHGAEQVIRFASPREGRAGVRPAHPAEPLCGCLQGGFRDAEPCLEEPLPDLAAGEAKSRHFAEAIDAP